MSLAGGIWRQFKLTLALSLASEISGKVLCTWGMTCIGGTRPPGNKWPSYSHMANISKYHTFNYGAHTGFLQIHTFSLMYTSDHIFSVLPIKQFGEPTTPHKPENCYKTFSIKPICFILYVCSM